MSMILFVLEKFGNVMVPAKEIGNWFITSPSPLPVTKKPAGKNKAAKCDNDHIEYRYPSGISLYPARELSFLQ